ncbi:MAG TPA: NADH-quinone oxidoreductase subunit K [Roseiflexaceae bacterium]|nr:NADH-quinone oxidoreductase subunit K [Roseiflexaceae bacterium]
MQVVLAFLIGGLFAIAIYLMLRRTIARIIIGLALLTNATNLLIFTVGGLTRAAPPLIPEGQYQPAGPIADPMPQSLILTAIVIGFGVLAFMMVLAFRTTQIVVADDIDRMRATDALVPVEKTDLAEPYDEEAESHPPEPGAAAPAQEAN